MESGSLARQEDGEEEEEVEEEEEEEESDPTTFYEPRCTHTHTHPTMMTALLPPPTNPL